MAHVDFQLRYHGMSPWEQSSAFVKRRSARQRVLNSVPGTDCGINDVSWPINDLHIWAFARIRGNCRPHLAIAHIGQPIVDYDTESDAGGDCSVGFIGPAREFSISGNLTSLAKSEPPPPLADGDHYREMAGRVRELAPYTYSPGLRRELVDLAKRYDRRGDHFERRSP